VNDRIRENGALGPEFIINPLALKTVFRLRARRDTLPGGRLQHLHVAFQIRPLHDVFRQLDAAVSESCFRLSKFVRITARFERISM